VNDKDNDDDVDGLVETREQVTPALRLEDPRVPPWQDLIAADRRRLLSGKDDAVPTQEALMALRKAHARVSRTRASKKKGKDVPGASLAELEQGKEAIANAQGNWTSIDPTTHPYRYTRGPDLTNDEMGYGERLDEELWFVVDGTIVSKWRSSQRTKSGRQFLFESPDRPAPSVVRGRNRGQ
jgi:hypothetical protein